MATQKAVADQPQEDPNKTATSSLPQANVPVDEKGNEVPLGPEALEKQRAAIEKTEKESVDSTKNNPLNVQGVEADLNNAKENPEASGQPDKEAVEERAKEVKEGTEKQKEEVKVKRPRGRPRKNPLPPTT